MQASHYRSESSSSWARLSIPGKELREARLQCHQAAQINTRLARGFVAPQADDSHTSLAWDPAARALTGQPVLQFRAGLRIADLTLVLLQPAGDVRAEFSLDGRTLEEALMWLGGQLDASGLDPAPLERPLHFELDDHPLLHGARFRLRGSEPLFDELARWYGNAALSLSAVSLPVRCWPHHFDIAAQIETEKGSIGVGMSPGDASYSEPYFYVTPWPYPDPGRLAELSTGTWHTEGWVGAVLTSGEILPGSDQQGFVQEFVESAVASLR